MRFRSRFGLIVLIAALLLIPVVLRFASTDLDLSGSAVNQALPTESADDSGSEPAAQDAESDPASDAENQDADSSENDSAGDESAEDETVPEDDTADDEVIIGDESGDNEATPEDDSADDEAIIVDESGDNEATPEDDSAEDAATPEDDSAGDDQSEATEEAGDDGTSSNESDDDQPEVTEEAGSGQTEVTEEPDDDQPEATEEAAPIETPAPEVTEEPVAEVTEEATAESQPAAPGITSVICVPGTGVVFVISNSGGDMTEDREYAIDGEVTGSFRLNEGDALEIQAGYGDPVLTSDDLEASLGSDCPAPGRIAGYVWENLNGDSTRNDGEPGIADVTVTLMMTGVEATEPITTITLEDGAYSFELLLAGTYTVTVDADALPPRLLPSYDLDGETDSTTVITLEAGQEVLADFGYTLEPPGAISGVVWDDQNGDGARSDDEPGIAGIQLSLTAGDETIAALTTDEAGMYAFADVVAGEYTLTIVSAPEDAQITADPDDELDGTTLVGVRPGATTEDVNFGYLVKQPGAISGVVFADLNGDGERGEDEPGLSGATISLGDTQISVTSADDGAYQITQLEEGDYTISVDVSALLDDYLAPENPAVTVTVLAGETTSDVNFGILPRPVSVINGVVFTDLNGNALVEDDEPGLPGINVSLSSGTGELLSTTTTDETGAFAFGDLSSGLYLVAANIADEDTGTPAAVMVEAGVDYTANFGFVPLPTGTVSGAVWVDADADGSRGGDESGLGGMSVNLLDADGASIAQAVTDDDGTYALDGVELGDYTVSLSDVPGGLAATFDPDGELDNQTAVTVTETGVQADFGYQVMSSSSISGLVWLETGNFGTRDSGETGLARAVVRLIDSEGNEISAVTLEADGRFSFDELEPGLYTLQVDVTALPAQIFATYDRDGELDFSTTIALRPGEALRDVEFGIVGTF